MQLFLNSIPFKIAHNSFKHLGITVTRRAAALLKANWHIKMNQLKDNIKFWRTLPMSMAGKINAIKMVTLPRFLYLFSSIPVLIPVKLFAKLESIIISFIWNYKNVRISKKHLFKPKAKGGFSLPHFRFYYWAANLQSLSWWRQTPENNGEIPEWVW